MKRSELRPELLKRIEAQIREDDSNKVRRQPLAGLRSAEPQQAPPKALERRDAKPKGRKSRLLLRITIVAFRRRLLDRHDNRHSAPKILCDLIAEDLGVKDDDERIEWVIDQVKSKTEGTTVLFELL